MGTGFALRALAGAVFVEMLTAAGAAGAPPTFNRDVAPILYTRCVSCHRPGEVAPMSLLTFQDARPWAAAIKARVASREMPPWFADPSFSHELANDNRLTDSQIATIVDWVDAGSPKGDGDAPPLPVFADGWHRFKNRPPDAIVEVPTAFDVPAEGVVPVFTLWSPNPFNEDKFIEAVELRPGARGAVHHSDVTARALPEGTKLGRGAGWIGGPAIDSVPIYPDGRSYNEVGGSGELNVGESAADVRARQTVAAAGAFRTTDDSRLLFYVPGGGFQQFPSGAVKRISAGNALAWGLHYTPTGKPEKDQHRLGLWFSQTPPVHEVITKRIGEAHIIEGREFVAEPGGGDFPTIPPFADDWRITAITPIQDDITLYGLWPHMHLRGKDMTFIATYPDGREDVLLHVPKYDFRWQLQYELVRPVHLPAGSTIKAIGHYDNSARNKNNPAPSEAVHWSEQTADEMFNGWMELSIDKAVIRRAVYDVGTPVNGRVSLRISGGPPGVVSVRNPDGTIVTSAQIQATPSFIEPWVFAAGQTVRADPTGSDIGDVTVTLYDVPADVTGSIAVDELAVGVTTTQPGQNGLLTFQGNASQRVIVHVIGNRVGSVAIRLLSIDGVTVLASVTSSAGSFDLAAVTLPSRGAYSIGIDPVGMNVGSLDLVVTSTGGR
jgi:hypothetical protein